MALSDRNTDITAAQWRAMAKAARQRSADSWERSDTDGFLSQWASDITAREYDAWADLAEQDYRAEFPALFDLSGNKLDAREVETKYGWAWAISTPTGTKWFNPSQARKGATRLANDRKKGYTVGAVLMDAYVKLTGSMTSVGPAYYPVPDAAEIILTAESRFYGVDY